MKAALPTLWLLLAACAAPPPSATVEIDGEILRLRADQPIHAVELTGSDGIPVLTRRLARPLRDLQLRPAWRADDEQRLLLRFAKTSQEITLHSPPSPGPLQVRIEAPIGQDGRSVTPGERVSIPVIEGTQTRIGLDLRVREPGRVLVVGCGLDAALDFVAAGELQVIRLETPGRACEIEIQHAAGSFGLRLQPRISSREQARAALRIEAVAFPADLTGQPDVGRVPGRITLPSPWLDALLRRTGLGVRARDREAPWGFLGVTVRNDSDRPINVVLQARILDEQGQPVPGFRPRMREFDGDSGVVSGLLRLPANGGSVGVLPVFVSNELLPPGASSWQRELRLTPLGSSEPLHTSLAPLIVKRGSTSASLGFAMAAITCLLGLLALALRARRWLSAPSTSELLLIGLFANLMFLTSAASQLLGMGASSLLGPFSALLTGLVNDAFRYALLATLVTLLPRPGVVTLALTVHLLMRGLALGGFSPVDPLMLGATVFWTEGCLYLAGVTRDGAWREQGPTARWLRLSAAFAPAALAKMAIGLVAAAVFYRLYYASWYVLLMLGLPGFLYVIVACWIAVGFADSLRQVEA